MSRVKARSLAIVTGFITTYLIISFINTWFAKYQKDIFLQNVLSALSQIRNPNQSVRPTESTVILAPSPSLTCQNGGKGLYLLFVVISLPDNVGRRNVIRSTFQDMRHDWESQFFANASLSAPTGNTTTTRMFQMLFFVGQTAENGISVSKPCLLVLTNNDNRTDLFIYLLNFFYIFSLNFITGWTEK